MVLREKVPRGREMFLLIHLCEYTHVRTFWTACFTESSVIYDVILD